jgi:8-oxo-dGTP pyrophosphatase MutT (NUDIX family)
MIRAAIRDEVLAIHPLDALEASHRDDALAWIDSGAELCRLAKPATPPKHLVSYFAVVADEHILLVDHRLARLWLPTGGHVEPGEHPRDAVRRELREELGIVPDREIAGPLMITCTTTVGETAGHTDVSLWYVIEASRTQELKHDITEFGEVQWFPWGRVPVHRADPHLPRFLRELDGSAHHSGSTTRTSLRRQTGSPGKVKR